MPSYDTVREDTIAAGRDVIACDSDGYIYTGQWTVTLPTGAEMAPLLAALPDALGDDWVITPGGLPRTEGYVDITDTTRKVGVSVSDYSDKATEPTIDMFATSTCGVLGHE